MAPWRLTADDLRLLALAVPNTVSNLSTPLLGLVDSVVAGHLPDPAALGGMALSLAVFNPLLFCFTFLRKSTVGLTAQAFGAKDVLEVRAMACRSICMGLFLGCALLALRSYIRQAYGLLGADDATVAQALLYYDTRILGMPAALANFAVQGWLLGVQASREALLANLVLNLSNAVLCVLLGVACGLGLTGVGLAAALANWLALAYGLWRVVHLGRSGPLSSASPLGVQVLLQADVLQRLLALNSTIFVRSLCITGMGAAFTVLSARLGRAVLAADNLLMQMQMLVSFGTDGFANAAEVLVGEAVGASDPQLLRTAVYSASKLAAAVAALFTALYVFAGQALLRGFTAHVDVLAVADAYLPWQWASPALSVWAYLLDGFFVGAALPGPMRDSMLLATLVFGGLVQLPLRNSVLWAAYLAHLVVRAVALGAAYPRIEALCKGQPLLGKP